MIERDYIMRMIDILSKVLARALFLRKSLEFPKAADELAAAARNLLGLDHDLILLMSDAQLIELLSTDELLGASKCYTLGMLLKEDAELSLEQGKQEEAAALLTKSASLLLTSFLGADTPVVPAHQTSVDEAIARLGSIRSPSPIALKLLDYYERTGRYDKAEDLLFDRLDDDPEFLRKGLALYERLLAHTDEDLMRGNLPRTEIEEGRRELQQRQNR